MRRVQGWAFRLLQEEKHCSSSFFLTLTYDDDHVPISRNDRQTLCKRHLQLFMKRLRKRAKLKTGKLIYYAVGEYGSKTARPHYHMILFNARETDIISSWDYGSVYFGDVRGGSVGYTLKYICKPVSRKRAKDDDRIPEFSLMSKGIGLSYITPEIIDWHQEALFERFYIPTTDGNRIPIPRIYQKYLYTLQEVELICAHVEAQQFQPFELMKWWLPARSMRRVSIDWAKARKNEKDHQTVF